MCYNAMNVSRIYPTFIDTRVSLTEGRMLFAVKDKTEGATARTRPTADCRWGFAGPGSSWVQVQWSEYFSLFKVTHYTSTLLLLLPLTFVFRGRPEQCNRFVLLLLLLLSAVELQTRVREDFTIAWLKEPNSAFTFKTLLRLNTMLNGRLNTVSRQT